MNNLPNELNKTRVLIDKQLDLFLTLPATKAKQVVEAMRYSCIGGGKAFRPFLILTTATMLNVPKPYALRVATALEMVHTYSLIHDDLPAMDNDTLRRGKPTNHIQFDEATAILAGDALLTKAFEILAQPETFPEAQIRCRLIADLAAAAGHNGMIGGQMIDLIGEKIPLTLDEIKYMQVLKTGALLDYACTASAIMAKACEEKYDALKRYAGALGLMFQITDDILDVEGDSKVVGKTLGKDSHAHKSTFVSTLGLDKARLLAKQLGHEAIESLTIFGDKADLLKQTVSFILTRNK